MRTDTCRATLRTNTQGERGNYSSAEFGAIVDAVRPLGDRAFWDLHVEGRLEIGEVQNYEQEMVDFGVAMRKMRSQMRVAVLEENCCGFDVGRALMHAHTTIALRRHGDLVRVQTAANALEAWQGGDFGGAFPQGFTHMLPNMTWQMPPHLVNEILGEMSGKFVLPVVWEAATKADDWAATVDSNSNATVVIGAELSEDKTRLLLHVVNFGATERNLTVAVHGAVAAALLLHTGKVSVRTQQMRGEAACRVGPQASRELGGEGAAASVCINTPAQPTRFAVEEGEVDLRVELDAAGGAAVRLSGLAVAAATFLAVEVGLE